MIDQAAIDRFLAGARGQALREGTRYARESRVGGFVGSAESVSSVVRGATGDFEVALWAAGEERRRAVEERVVAARRLCGGPKQRFRAVPPLRASASPRKGWLATSAATSPSLTTFSIGMTWNPVSAAQRSRYSRLGLIGLSRPIKDLRQDEIPP